MERLTEKDEHGNAFIVLDENSKEWSVSVDKPSYTHTIQCEAIDKLAEYEDAEEQGLLLRLDSKDELIEVLAKKLLNSEFGNCYMCTNPMKNITLDGINNGCDGECKHEEFTVDDFLKKIISELKYRNEKALEDIKGKV